MKYPFLICGQSIHFNVSFWETILADERSFQTFQYLLAKTSTDIIAGECNYDHAGKETYG